MIAWVASRVMKPLWPVLAALGAALLAFMGGKRQGRLKERHKQDKQSLDAMRKAKEVRDEVDSTSNDDVRNALDDWMRD